MWQYLELGDKRMFEISKQISLCYGHRVWSQDLEEEFCASGDTACKCKHQHGHQGEIQVFLEASDVNHQGFVTDFKHLGWLRDFVDNYFDHKMIYDLNDPGLGFLCNGIVRMGFAQDYKINNEIVRFEKPEAFELYSQWDNLIIPMKEITVEGKTAGYVLDLEGFEDQLESSHYEILEGYFFVNFVPTSENLCKFIHGLAQEKMKKIGVTVSKVLWQETPKSQATFIAKPLK
ncbi:6-pyruvoyl tetrahydropterin synthase/QueD family protein [Vibrio phage 2.275.O._10N.286.54.E11]|nr:6-pyruvoyl tetrahydropterin synthase/QueD family protein [Vibrio phage 2.275.O._10N.286.54.E11]